MEEEGVERVDSATGVVHESQQQPLPGGTQSLMGAVRCSD